MRFGRTAVAILSLVRWENALLSVAGVMLGAWSATGRPGEPETLVMAGVAVLLTAFANADNDVRDFDIDRVAHPDRPLPSGALSIETARIIVGIAAASALVLSALLGGAQTFAAVAVIGAMTLYNRGVKAQGVPGNVIVAVVASLPFVFGAWSAGAVRDGLPLFLVGVPLHFAREIAKDLDDAHGDASYRRTLPLRAGPGAARLVVVTSLALFVAALAPLAVHSPAFAIIVLPAVALCLVAARRVWSGQRGTARLLKSAMVVAMVAFVL
ncbi:MAG TPA: UbiA family prenyltransferase, partial [Gemmatimonadaceae bacterium]|nr:UbiA family prenyltransferase [Gemmatimonadaceae bacterium]